MNDSQGTLYYPPVTSNKLNASQRARLMRSTRKLGALLGTTPRLADPEPIPIKLPLSRSSIDSCSSYGRESDVAHDHSLYASYTSSAAMKMSPIYASPYANSSVASIPIPPPQSSMDVLPTPKSFSSKARRSKEAPRPLVLRYNTVTVDADDIRVPMSPFIASAVPECVTPATPSTPTEAEIRRKRMAKLNRTFGENVPPEFVFTSAAPTPRAANVSQKMQTQEVVITPPPRRSSRVWVTGNSAGNWIGEWNRRDIREVQQKLRALKAR
ncbi:hypothetical protein NM688_g2324 [Phlebia brevispora]|uniref:Uncharacterized protein n=1 Tax=Phlebia brevispora TaxID=194682 RepID=A0ACC1T8T7_9APHY|nr:hypothetical protein NM688_g2324 [Phlebia brevispora]